MKSFFRAALAALCALGFASPVLAEGAPRTVSEYFDAMETSATHLDAEVADRQKTGDMGAAQRIALVAAMVRRAAAEFRGAEQEYMLDPVSDLPAPIPARADEALAKSAAAESAAERSAFIDEAQITFNALIGALPQKTLHPIVYGMLVNDLADPAAPLPSDVVFYGFRLVDSVYKIAPTVAYGRTEFAGASAVVKDDRIDVALPDAVKTAVRFAPTPCESRLGFALRVHMIFSIRHGFWPIAWHTQSESNADFFALPTPTVYSATIVTTSAISASSSSTETFEQRSSVVNADCDQMKSGDVTIALPVGATDAKCNASWVDDTGATKIASRCRIEGQQAHATGEISGGAKVCSPDKLCTCSVPAQGWLEARGSYRMKQTTTESKVDSDPTHVAFAAGGVGEQRVAVRDDRKLRHLALAITRRGCATVVDTIDLNIGDDPEGQASNASASGEFRAVIKAPTSRSGQRPPSPWTRGTRLEPNLNIRCRLVILAPQSRQTSDPARSQKKFARGECQHCPNALAKNAARS